MTLRPFWRYYGAKWRIAPRYPAPRHRTIIEPFAAWLVELARSVRRDQLELAEAG